VHFLAGANTVQIVGGEVWCPIRPAFELKSTREFMFTSISPTCTGRTLSLPRKDQNISHLRSFGNLDIADNTALDLP